MSSGLGWYTEDEFPELRSERPWVMQEMIAAQPAVVDSLLRSPPPGVPAAAAAITQALDDALPVTVCGCGTSEHAALGVASLLAATVGPGRSSLVRARPAFSAAQDPRPGVCLAVSHDGGTRATTLALSKAAAVGARTIAITQKPDSAVAHAAELVLVTPRHDESWCHTLAYTSALAAGTTLAAGVGPLAADPPAIRQLLEQAMSSLDAAPLAEQLADRRVVICAAAEPDLGTARELALKIAEGAHVPTLALELETVLHGQLVAHEPADALILVAITDAGDQTRALRRSIDVVRAATTIGLRVTGLLSDSAAQTLGGDLIPQGRLITHLPAGELVDPRVAGLLAGAGALQTLALELAHARNINPDLIRREEDRYRHAAQAAESSEDW